MRTGLLLAALALLSCAGLAAAAGPADQGKALFQKDCSSCHTIGGGDRVGPDLKGVTDRSGVDAVRQFIAAPDKVIAAGDPKITALVKKFHGVKMPNFGLAADQVDALVAYLQAQSGGAKPGGAGGATTTPAATGDAAAGRKLFTGATTLAHGGPACISCHSIAGAGALGGGRVGPDLTKAFAKYGGTNGVVSVLGTIAFPTMVPVYKGHALTRQEQANLAAFLQTTSAKQPGGDRWWLLVVLGVAVVVIGVVLALVIWPRRRLVVRRRLVPPPTFRRS
jgi:mono/diheme cytochrome c family protein